MAREALAVRWVAQEVVPSNDMYDVKLIFVAHIAVIRAPETNTRVVRKTTDIRTPRIVGCSRSNFLVWKPFRHLATKI